MRKQRLPASGRLRPFTMGPSKVNVVVVVVVVAVAIVVLALALINLQHAPVSGRESSSGGARKEAAESSVPLERQRTPLRWAREL